MSSCCDLKRPSNKLRFPTISVCCIWVLFLSVPEQCGQSWTRCRLQTPEVLWTDWGAPVAAWGLGVRERMFVAAQARSTQSQAPLNHASSDVGDWQLHPSSNPAIHTCTEGKGQQCNMLLLLKRVHPCWLIVRCCFPCNYTTIHSLVGQGCINCNSPDQKGSAMGNNRMGKTDLCLIYFCFLCRGAVEDLWNRGWRTQHNSKSFGYMPGRSDHHWQHHWFVYSGPPEWLELEPCLKLFCIVIIQRKD